jgi:hypothetical protein
MIDISKQYRTRDGREVRIYATDGVMPRPVHGAVKSSYDSTWHSFQWHEDGRLVHNVLAVDLSDLIEVRPRHKRTVWLAVYPNGYIEATSKLEWRNGPCIGGPYDGEKPIACIKVDLDFCEGDGL